MTLFNSGGELDEPLQVPIKTAAQMLGFSRQTLYKMREWCDEAGSRSAPHTA